LNLAPKEAISVGSISTRHNQETFYEHCIPQELPGGHYGARPQLGRPGSYTATSSQINFDDDGGDGGFTMNYAIIGNEMSVTGTIDGQSFTGLFIKQ
jgi:hypothetical protein